MGTKSINELLSLNEKKLKLNISTYMKEMNLGYSSSSDLHFFRKKLIKNEEFKNTYLLCLSCVLNEITFNIYKYLLNYDLERDADEASFKLMAKEINLYEYTDKVKNRHLKILEDLGLIFSRRAKIGHIISINYDFIIDNLTINNFYNTRKFFDILSPINLENLSKNNFKLNDFIKEKIKRVHENLLKSNKKDFTDEQIEKVLENLYRIELEYKSKKTSFVDLNNKIYVYYNLKENVTNRDFQILNYLTLLGKINCITIGGVNRYRIVDKDIIKIDSSQVQELKESEKNIIDEVDAGSLTLRQKTAIINTLDKFLNENDIDISDNKYKLLLKYGYYLKSRNISEFSYLAYIKEIITQKFDDNKLNYIVTDMINKNFTNLFNYLDKNNISSKTNATEMITTEVKTTQSSSNNNPLTKLTREEFAKLQEGRGGGKLYEEIDEYKAQGKTEVEYIKDKLGIDISNR